MHPCQDPSLKLNSAQANFLKTSTLDDSRHIHPNHTPLNSTIPFINFIKNSVFCAFLGLIPENVDCYSERANYTSTPPTVMLHTTLHILFYSIQVQHFHYCIPFSGKLWRSLPLLVFPPANDLNFLMREV